MAIPNHWIGNANAVAAVFTVTYATTATGGGNATVTVGNKTVSLAYLTGATPTTLATAVANALANSTVPEFAEYDWTNPSAGVVQGSAKTAGRPALVSAATTGGTGITATYANVALGTGPNSASLAANYSLGLPTNAHDLVFDGGPDLLYDLGAPGYATPPASVRITSRFARKKIGLSDYRTAQDGTEFLEYLPRHFNHGSALVVVGEGPGDGASGIRLQMPDASSLRVLKAAQSVSDTESAVEVTTVTGESIALIAVYGGSVAWGTDVLGDPTTTLAALTVNGEDASFRAGPTHTITAARLDRGSVRGECITTTLTMTGGTYSQEGGSVGTIIATGGSAVLAHEQATDIAAQFTGIGSGTPPSLDCSPNSLHRQLGSTSYFRKGATVNDPFGSTDLDAVAFDDVSRRASALGGEVSITRP